METREHIFFFFRVFFFAFTNEWMVRCFTFITLNVKIKKNEHISLIIIIVAPGIYVHIDGKRDIHTSTCILYRTQLQNKKKIVKL